MLGLGLNLVNCARLCAVGSQQPAETVAQNGTRRRISLPYLSLPPGFFNPKKKTETPGIQLRFRASVVRPSLAVRPR